MEENKVDLEKLQKQREEAIRKTNEYCEVRIIIGKNDTCPYAHFESRKVSSLEHALILKSMEEVMCGVVQRDPQSYEIYKNMRFKVERIEQEIEENGNHIPRID